MSDLTRKVVQAAEVPVQPPSQYVPAEQARLEALTAATKVEKINGKLPMSLLPDTILNYGRQIIDLGDDGPGVTGFVAARQALHAMYTAINDVDAAYQGLLKTVVVGRRQLDGKPIERVEIPLERRAELAAAMGNRTKRMAHAVARSNEVLDASIAELDRRIANSIRHPRADTPATIAEAVQIRDFMRSLHREDRLSLLHKSCSRKDLAVISAVFSASSWASGLEPEELERYRPIAHQEFAPREYRHAQALRGIQLQLHKASDDYAKQYKIRLPEIPVNTPSVDAMARLKAGA